jgi:hypothetical protein
MGGDSGMFAVSLGEEESWPRTGKAERTAGMQIWKRNLLFVSFCALGAGGLAGGLLRTDGVQRPETLSDRTLSTSDVRDVVRRVDAEFRESWRRQGLQPAACADDLTLARRLSLGLTGTVPSLEEIRVLESIPAGERLPWWISRLLEDRRYADYVAERLARACVGTENGPFLVYRRRRFVTWLSDLLHENVPYDRIVHELIAAEGIWTSSPAVNFVSVTVDQTEEDRPDPVRLAGRTSRAFLGMRIDCLQCHDDNLGNINLGTAQDPRSGTQADFHRLAAFYSETEVSLLGIGDQPREYRYKFLNSEHEEIVDPAPPFLADLLSDRGSRRQQLADWITHPENKPFARATVNRVWALLFGRPLVEPIDDIPLYGALPPGLEALAADFVDHHYDLRRLIRAIAATQVFQLDSRAEFVVTERHERHWAVFPLTRLRPEQVAGALIQSASLTTIDAQSHILLRLARFGNENEFVGRYGDRGEDEFEDRGGTVTQRLLMMNGRLVKDKTAENAIVNAATKIAILAPDDAQAVETVYLCTLSRRPSKREREYFVDRLQGTRAAERSRRLEDIQWTLLNSTELSWNH